MFIQIKPHVSDFIAPKRGSSHAAGLDIFAQDDLVITEETQLIDLGFSAAVPEGYAAVLMPRSGSGAKFNMQLSNTLGLIDSDYRGPWKAAIHLGNKGTEGTHLENGEMNNYLGRRDREYAFRRGEAMCQMIFIEVPLMDVVVSDEELPATVRGDGGFGSTDKPRA